MKKSLKVLSLIFTIVMLIGTVSVGMSAYAASDDVLGDYDFEITNVYKDIDWANVGVYKAATHVHTVRSDADTEIDDMIHEYYRLGYDAMALTDHGTINYGWTNDQDRVTIFEYQYFVHGPTDELSESDYKNIITGARDNRGTGMMEIPLGIELNGMSTIKCHVNGFYADADHGGIGMAEDWPRSAVVKNYNAGGFTHINHVGEWSEGNDDASVYSASWLTNFTKIFEDYCPNRGGRGTATQTAWMNSHKAAGCIGMELVNTADSRTHNDRRFVYDEILKRLAPQGINVFGFCEDDAHEYSDCDRNAQFFLINKTKDVKITSAQYDASNKSTDKHKSAYLGDDNDPMDKVQNYYRDAMFYGEFITSSKNAKNSYELGNGFSASGPYPTVSNIQIIDEKNQIAVTFKDATKIRMVADGEVIETVRTSTSSQTVIFDLNRNEAKINSYVRIYLTGAGGITFLQPFLVKKAPTSKTTVQFITPTSDTDVVVKDSTGAVVSDSCKYENFYYVLPAGEYTYTASRRGFETKTESFTVVDSQSQKIPVDLEEKHDISYAYFYAPETIYLNPSDNQTFDKYIDRENAVNGALHNEAQTAGNIFFYREGATDLELQCDVIEGKLLESNSVKIASTKASATTLATQVTAGKVTSRVASNEYVLIKWTMKYKYNGVDYEAYTYSYVYSVPSDNHSILGAGGYAETTKNVTPFTGWMHSTMYIASSLYVTGIHKLVTVGSDSNVSYKYAPNTGYTLGGNDSSPIISGTGMRFKSENSSGGSKRIEINNTDNAYIYADRSRINNWSEIPYFAVGFDLNAVTQTTGENGGNAAARLAFDSSLVDVRDNKFDKNKTLYDLEFSSRSSYTEVIDYNLTDSGKSSQKSGSVSNSIADIGVKRFYISDNNSSDKKLVYPLPAASVQESVIPISAYVIGTKESRNDEICTEVNVTVVNINKDSLRKQFNDTVKESFQRNWFASEADWQTYQATVAKAAKLLGNPVAEAEELETAVQNLQDIVDNFVLKTGTMVVKHYWAKGGNTGLIYSEAPVVYEYSNDLSANAAAIAGYTYANKYECYSEGKMIEEGTTDFDLAFAERPNYEWRFYYTPNEYNVTYDTMGAGAISSYAAKASYGQSYTVSSETPQKTGYTFDGWYLDNTQKKYSAGATFNWNYAGDGEFKAQWKSNTYEVSYDVNGGNSIIIPADYRKVSFGETYSVISTVPERTGYAFAGWKLNGGNVYTSGANVYWDIATESKFVAQWEVAEFKVTFDKVVADATLSFNEKTVVFDEPYGTLPEATRNGYTAEWYADPNYMSASKVTASTNVGINANHTLYAKWTPIDYTITYNLDGGAVTGGNPTMYNIETGAITLKPPVKTGYSFVGWSSPDFSGVKATYTIPAGSTGDKTFTANWDLSGYTITYNLDGGQNNANNPSSYKVSDTVTLSAPTKKGYRFIGWTGDNGTVAEASVTIPAGSTGNKAYTANWQLETYTIAYDYDGATTTPTTNPASYTVNTNTFTLANPEKFGYTFSGWECNNDALSGKNVTITKGAVTGNLTFKAIWAENGARTVTYVLNGGKVEGSNPASYKDGQTFSIINPTKDGYTFAGWIKKVGTTSEAATTSAKILATDNADITFTATWNIVDYTINYNLAGGRIATAQTNPVSYNAESAAITLANPVKAGYSFEGWTGTGLTTASKVVTIETGSTGNRNYTATWKANKYTITYNLNGGADAGFTKSYTSATTATIGAPVRAGYTFDGWSVAFTNFTWNSGTINSNGTFAAKSNSFYSDGIVLRSGSTYNLTNTSLKMYAFDKSGALIGTYTSSITPSKDCVVYIVADNQSSTDALRSVKLELADNVRPASFALQAETADKFGNAGNMEMTANWSDETYNITYDYDTTLSWGVDSEGNQLANPNPATYKYSSSDILLKNPSKPGYTFVGWECDGVVSPATVIKSGSTGNKTFKAVIERTEYTITYSSIDGASVSGNPATYNVDSSDITLKNPTKTGYVFEGWVGTGVSVASKSVKIEKGSTGDKTFIATWTPVSYAISYNGIEGATVSNPNSYTIESDTFTLANPTKAGATFAGWVDDATGTTLANVTIDKGSTGNKAYTATWSYSDYTITYDLAGGTETTNPTSYKVTSADITLAAPTKAGYTFKGWTGTGLDSMTTSVVIKTGSTGHRSYTANWQVINYTIAYDLAGGQVAQNANPTTYNTESATITLVNPVKAGFKFAGWTGTGLKEAAMEVTIPHGSKDNRTYTATWAEDGYTITYTGLEGATLSSENRTFYTVATNDFTLNNPEKRGYAFEGWSGTGISGSGISKTVTVAKGSTGNRSYNANWSLEEYTIDYNFDGGSEGGIKNPRSYNINSTPFTLYAPVKTGYDFVGWESDYFDGTQASVTIDPNETVGDKSFKAVWSTGSYTIKLNPNGGTLPSGQQSTVTFTYDTATFTIKNPTRAGYTFAGWTGTGLTSKVETLTINKGSTGNREYTAVWISSSENKITYNLNGGSVSSNVNPESYVTNSGSIILTNPTKDGYKFAGWVVEQESVSGIVQLVNGGKLASIDTSFGGSAYISASWTPSPYKITYNLNGGTNSSANPKTYTIEDTFTLTNPTRTGYTFKGWTGTDLDESKPSTNVSVSNKVGGRTYTAHWGEAEYAITYDYNGGSATEANPTSFNVLTPSFTLNNPVKDGYVFTGWTGSNGTTPQKTVTIAAGSSGARNYTANFSRVEYTIKFSGVDKAPITYNVDSADIAIENPSKAGYEFVGWQYDGAVNPEKNVVVPHGSTGNKEFTAIFKEAEYKITYNLDGGVVSGTNPETYTIESSKITLMNPVKNGFTFVGWYDGKTTQEIVEIPKGSTGDRSYTAKWNVAPYKISYTGVPSSVLGSLPTSFTADKDTVIPDPIMPGYTFNGWTGTGLETATKNLVIPAGSSGNRIYKATWTMNDYTITVDYDGGSATTTVPTTYTVDSEDINLGVPVKDGYTFAGWTGTDYTTPTKAVTLKTGSTGDKFFKANWIEGTGSATHRFYFRGYADAKLYVHNEGSVHYDYIEVTVGTPVNIKPSDIDQTAGYKITGWDIDLNDPKYVNSYEDVTVHGTWDYGDEVYSIIANGTEPVSKTATQYEKVTVTTAAAQGDSVFCYWVESKVGSDGSMQPGAIVSYYRNYTFYAHSDVVLMAVYSTNLNFVRAATRITKIEKYDPDYDWVTINSERSVGPEFTIVQHGVLFTANPSSGTDSGLVIGGTNVYKSVAKTKNLTGNWAVSIPNPYSFGTGKTFYIRSFVTYADEDGNKTTKYSAIKTYVNNEDITPN